MSVSVSCRTMMMLCHQDRWVKGWRFHIVPSIAPAILRRNLCCMVPISTYGMLLVISNAFFILIRVLLLSIYTADWAKLLGYQRCRRRESFHQLVISSALWRSQESFHWNWFTLLFIVRNALPTWVSFSPSLEKVRWRSAIDLFAPNLINCSCCCPICLQKIWSSAQRVTSSNPKVRLVDWQEVAATGESCKTIERDEKNSYWYAYIGARLLYLPVLLFLTLSLPISAEKRAVDFDDKFKALKTEFNQLLANNSNARHQQLMMSDSIQMIESDGRLAVVVMDFTTWEEISEGHIILFTIMVLSIPLDPVDPQYEWYPRVRCFDFYSQSTSAHPIRQTYQYVAAAWEKLVETGVLNEFDKIINWSDGGPHHFRVYRTHRYFSVLAERMRHRMVNGQVRPLELEWHLLWPRRGHSRVDAHFGVLKCLVLKAVQNGHPVCLLLCCKLLVLFAWINLQFFRIAFFQPSTCQHIIDLWNQHNKGETTSIPFILTSEYINQFYVEETECVTPFVKRYFFQVVDAIFFVDYLAPLMHSLLQPPKILISSNW